MSRPALIGSLADGWRFDVEAIDYAAVGFGSYHWVATDPRGTRRFVTVDDLEQKPWLGDTRETVFDGLMRSFDTAVALRDAGLGFVVAPIITSDGEAGSSNWGPPHHCPVPVRGRSSRPVWRVRHRRGAFGCRDDVRPAPSGNVRGQLDCTQDRPPPAL